MLKRLALVLTAAALATAVGTACANGTDAEDQNNGVPVARGTDAPAPAESTAAQAVVETAPSVPPSETPASGPTPVGAASAEAPTTTEATAESVSLESLSVELQPAAGGLDTPIGLANAGDGSGRLFVIEKGGAIRVVQAGEVLAEPFLDLRDRVNASGSEQGLLGLAFHPGYAANGFFFVDYTDQAGDTVVSRFRVTADPNRADPASEEIVLTQRQPAGNHNGGHLAFGPDGYLYIALGDGGGAGDTYGNGQNLQSWLGTLLRIDVDELPYSVPPDNPFVGDSAALDEIWAYGLRNPWRFSFDRATDDLYIADVGQNQYEEIDFEPASSPGGENYGWPIMEGLHCYPEGANCDPSGLVLPVAEYDHSQGCSVTGGYVYRGEAFPAMQGVYFFADWCSGLLWGLAPGPDGGWQSALLLDADGNIASFGEGEAGELYAVDMQSGTVYQVAAR